MGKNNEKDGPNVEKKSIQPGLTPTFAQFAQINISPEKSYENFTAA